MSIVKSTPELHIVRLHCSESIANAIRRSINEIPTLAIDEVEIYRNDSALYDEMLAHRIGLVPLKNEKGMSDKTKIELKLTKTGPCTVYSGDLEGNAEVVFDKMPLTILGKDQKVELVATAILGKGIVHAKHNPGMCYYRHLKLVTASPEIDAIVKNSKGSIAPEKKGNTWTCDLTEGELLAVTELDASAVKDSDELILTVESFGMFPAKDILAKAVTALEENLDEFESIVKKASK